MNNRLLIVCRVLWRCGGKAANYMVWQVKKDLEIQSVPHGKVEGVVVL